MAMNSTCWSSRELTRSIARRIAEANGGTLTLRSRAGEGTVATLSLPAAPGAP